MPDFDEMRNAVNRALMLSVEAADRIQEAELNKTLCDAMLVVFDDLAQCLIEYGDTDLAATVGDVSVTFATRHKQN